jgi:hypothetical protein
MGVLMRRVLTGDEKLAEWSAEDAESLDAARRRLREELAAGYMAVRADHGDNEPLRELPADADVVILTMPMGGG